MLTKTLLTAAALSLVSVTAMAAPAAHKASSAKAAKVAPLVCAVTGDKIASVKDAAGSSTYKGKTYYFCCQACKPEFDASPAKFVKTAKAATAKPVTKPE